MKQYFANLRVTRHDVTELGQSAPVEVLFTCAIERDRSKVVADSVPSDRIIRFSDRSYTDSLNQPITQVGTEIVDRESIATLLTGLSLGTEAAVDLTGLMRDKAVLLCDELFHCGVERIRCFYTEPGRYLDAEETIFARALASSAAPVPGFAGPLLSGSETNNDLLIIGVGYDRRQLRVAMELRAARVFIYGLPALQPGMYQESVLRAEDAGTSGFGQPDVRGREYAAAHDPFEFADMVAQVVESHETRVAADFNLYICPLGPKPQALGAAMFYRTFWTGRAGGVYLPVVTGYAADHAEGVSRVWEYELVAEAWESNWV